MDSSFSYKGVDSSSRHCNHSDLEAMSELQNQNTEGVTERFTGTHGKIDVCRIEYKCFLGICWAYKVMINTFGAAHWLHLNWLTIITHCINLKLPLELRRGNSQLIALDESTQWNWDYLNFECTRWHTLLETQSQCHSSNNVFSFPENIKAAAAA